MRSQLLTTLLGMILAIALSGSISAQTVHGAVTGPDGVPVAGAKIEVAGESAHAWTDAWGRYSLSPAPVGARTLRAVSSDF